MATLGVGRANNGYALIPSSDPTAAEEGMISTSPQPESETSEVRTKSKGSARSPQSEGAAVHWWQDLIDQWQFGEFTIIPEDNKYLDGWDVVVIFALVFTAALVPYEVAYFITTEVPQHLRVIDGAINFVFGIDIFVTFNVAYVINNPIAVSSVELYERRPMRIARKYMSVPFVRGLGSGWFWPDVLTVLPWDDISGGVQSVRLLRVLKLLRMLRLVRIIKLLDRWHYSLGISYSTINLSGCMGITIASIHWLACVWGAVATDVEDGTHTWLTRYLDRNDQPHSRGDSSIYVYNLAVYYVVMTMTSVGFGDIVPLRSFEVIVSTVLVFFLGFLWAYIIASITSIITRFDEVKTHFQQMNDDLNIVMDTRRLPSAMKMRIRRHICESFKVYRQRHQQQTMKDSLSLGLQGDIAIMSGVDRVVGCVWYLRGIESDVLVELVNFFAPSIFSPGEFIINKDSVSIICRGTCMKKGRVLGRDAVFGEDMLLRSEMLKEKVYPRTLTFVEIMMLTRTDLRHVCIKFPDFQVKMRKAQVKLALWRGFIYYAEQVRKEGPSACFTTVLAKGPKPFDIGDPLDEVDFKLNRVNDSLNERFDVIEQKMQLMLVQRHLTAAPGIKLRRTHPAASRQDYAAEQEPDIAEPASCGEDASSAEDAPTMQGTLDRPKEEPPLPQDAACLQKVLEELARMERLSDARDASLREHLRRIEQEQAALAPRLSLLETGIGALQAKAEEKRPSRERTANWKDNAAGSGGAPDQMAMGGFASSEYMVAAPLVSSVEAAGERLNAALGEQLRGIEAAERQLALQVEAAGERLNAALGEQLRGIEGAERQLELQVSGGERLNAALGEQLRGIEAAEQQLALQVERFAAHVDRAAEAARDVGRDAQPIPAIPAQRAGWASPQAEGAELQLCIEAERGSMVTILRDHSAALTQTVSMEMERLGVTVRHSVEAHLHDLRESVDEMFKYKSEDMQRSMSVNFRRLQTATPQQAEAAAHGAASLASSLTPQGHAQWLKRNGIVEDAWSTQPLPQRPTGMGYFASATAARSVSTGD